MNTLFTVAMIIEALAGIGCLFVPAAVFGPFGVTLDEIATPFVRLLGSTLISFSVLLWLARRSDSPEFRKGVGCSLFAYYLVSAVLLVITQMAGLMNALGWSTIGVHVALLVWFGYYIVKK